MNPADWLLERLRVHGVIHRADEKKPQAWQARCVLCERPLTVREHGDPLDRPLPASVTCQGPCSEAAITAALRMRPVELELTEAWRLYDELRALAQRALTVAGTLEVENATLRRVVERGLDAAA